MGDIEKMFLQVKEKEEYLDEHRFTWRDEDQEYIPDNTILSNIFQKKTLCTLLVCVLKQSVKNETNIIQQIVNENCRWTVFSIHYQRRKILSLIQAKSF